MRRRAIVLLVAVAVGWAALGSAWVGTARAAINVGGTSLDSFLAGQYVVWAGLVPCTVDTLRAKVGLRLEPGASVTFGFEQPARSITGPTSTITNDTDDGMAVTIIPGYQNGASYHVQYPQEGAQFRLRGTGNRYSVVSAQVWGEGDPSRDCTPYTAPAPGSYPTPRPTPVPTASPSTFTPITPPPDVFGTPAPSGSAEYCMVGPALTPVMVPCDDPEWFPTPSPTAAPDYDYSFACSMTYPAPGDGGNIGCNDFTTAETADGWYAIDGHTYELTFTFAHTTTYGHNPHADVFAYSTGTFPASFEGTCLDGPDFADVNRTCETTYQRVDLDDSLETLSPRLYLWCYAWGGPSDSGSCSLTITDITEPTASASASPSPTATPFPWAYPPTYIPPGEVEPQPTLPPGPVQPPATANPNVQNPGQPATGWFYPTTGLGAPPGFDLGGCEPDYPKPGQLPAIDLGTAPFPGATLDVPAWLNWIGSILTLLPRAMMNIAITVWNLIIDAVVPGSCLDDILSGAMDDLMGLGPFALYSEAEGAVQAALDGAGSDTSGWCVPLWGGGEACLPLDEWDDVVAPARGAAGAFVWLMALIGAAGIVSGSFGVARGRVVVQDDMPGMATDFRRGV